MQMRRLKDPASKSAFNDCQSRVQAIALIHEKLYQSHHFINVALPDYVSSLARDIFQAASLSPTIVSLDVAIVDIALPIDKAIPCGLILNELIGNAMKHAFPDGRRGSINVRIERFGVNCLKMIVADDGAGMPAGVDIRSCQTMGMQLINTLAAQLDAQLEVEVHGGTSFQVTFALEV
jgi:two-component sensor histidine kinase